MSLPERKKDRTSPAYQRARKQEKESALRLGGRQTVASGSKCEKADIRVEGKLRLECKCTSRKSYSIKREDFLSVMNSAVDGEIPAMEIEFLGEGGKVELALAILPRYILKELCQS